MGAAGASAAYAVVHDDPVRAQFEEPFFARILGRLLRAGHGGRMLDMGCGDGRAGELAGARLEDYVGVDFRPGSVPGRFVLHDLREGLGPVGRAPFDLYFGGFGVSSHLDPAQLSRLLADIARHARPASLVAIEALGLYSLEWPRLWETPPGAARKLRYRLASEVTVHPWSPRELAALFAAAGLEWIGSRDRSVQTGPKVGESRYWPGVPRLRDALRALLVGDSARSEPLHTPLPPLPAHRAAALHHTLAARRAALLGGGTRQEPAELAEAVWALEPRTGGGYGHGVIAVGCVR
jgi:SAM-dependent methyltransferase